MAKVGRPTKRTAELEDALVAHVAEAKTIRAFCRDNGRSSATVYGWIADDLGGSLSERLARARTAGQQLLEEECLSIADSPMDPSEPDRDVRSRKLRIWTRIQRLTWSDTTGRYSTKSTVAIGGAVGLPPVKFTDDERADRIKHLLDKAASRNGKQSPSATRLDRS